MVLALNWFSNWLKVDTIIYEVTLSFPNIIFIIINEDVYRSWADLQPRCAEERLLTNM